MNLMKPRQAKVHDSCCKEKSTPQKWYRKPVVLLSAVSGALLGASYFFPVLIPFRHTFAEYVRMMAWPVVLGLLLGGLMDRFVPQEYISKYLSRPGKRTVFYAVGFGFLMSACSHGILALSMELHRKGASGPAVISFLLASPWANLPITVLLVGLFGWRGLVIIASALVVATVTGLIFQQLHDKGLIERSRHLKDVDQNFSIRRDVARRFQNYRFSFSGLAGDLRAVAKGGFALADMIIGWILIGILLASLASAVVPHHVFGWFGPTASGLLLTLVLAAILEVCSEGTAPLAFEIYKQTGAFGNVFCFLMGGVVTDYTEVGLVWGNLGRRTALWMLAITLPQVFLLAYLFNRLL